MNIFKFINPQNETLFDQGQIINNLKAKLWIERYRDASEFELKANAELMIHKQLPIGSMISHVDSTEVMIVENHEIKEEVGKEPEVKITGRSFESFLENRVVGINKDWASSGASNSISEHVVSTDYTWNQTVELIKMHIDPARVYDPNDALWNIEVVTNIIEEGWSPSLSVARGNLYTRIIEIMNIDKLGIKTVRPGVRSPLGSESSNLAFLIHKGEDLSKEVVFSYETDSIENADYLWSNKNLKNVAMVSGRFFETVVKDSSLGYGRRMMYIDASDIDGSYTGETGGIEEITALNLMNIRGLSELSAQKETSLVKAEPSKNSTMYKYREHYDVGDIITVEGSYNETSPFQITEYVEIEDESGQNGYPTLSAV